MVRFKFPVSALSQRLRVTAQQFDTALYFVIGVCSGIQIAPVEIIPLAYKVYAGILLAGVANVKAKRSKGVE